MKPQIYIIIGGLLVIMTACFFVGRATVKQEIGTTVTVDTLNLTSQQRDSINKSWEAKMLVIKKGQRTTTTTDPQGNVTVNLEQYVDTTTYNAVVASYEILVRQLTSQLAGSSQVTALQEVAKKSPFGVGIILDHTGTMRGFKSPETGLSAPVRYHSLVVAPKVEYAWSGKEWRWGAGIGFMK